jgi:hypothetical protein
MGLTWEDTGDLYIDEGKCAVCGKPTYRMGSEKGNSRRGEKEPLICNRCLLDLRGDMATELEVRRQLGNLEAQVQAVDSKVESRLDTRLWVLGIVLAVVLTVAGFFAGAYLT